MQGRGGAVEEHSKPGRRLVVGVHNTDSSINALNYALQELWRNRDVIHVVMIVNCMLPDKEIFHGFPGTTFKFHDPRPHHELEEIGEAREFIKTRIEPLLTQKLADHEFHLLVENKDCLPKAYANALCRIAEDIQADILIVGARDTASSADETTGLGSVSHWLARHPPPTPLVLVPLSWQSSPE
eukprot:jgi/Botrbrau1/12646/Bobra.67_1s0012.1